MAMKFGKRDVAKMVAVIDQDFDTAEDAALAALEAAMQIIETKANFTVVGQVKTKDASGDKIALAWYGTLNQATQDALKLTYSAQTHEEHFAWVLPIFHGTPANYYAKRKTEIKQAERENGSFWERELARRVEWIAARPGQQPPHEWNVVIPHYTRTEPCPFCDGAGRVPIDTESEDQV